MVLLVRDEDVPTVAEAIHAFADEEGLEPIDLHGEHQDPLTMLSVLTGPRALLSTTADAVVALGLDSLDVADADEWAAALSAACETEVVAIEPAADGLRVWVFDSGEIEEEIELPLDPSGRTRSPALAALTTDDEGRRALERGIAAASVDGLLQGVLGALGVRGPGADATMLAFLDPLDEDDLDEEPRFDVAAMPGAGLAGAAGDALEAPYGPLFGVTLRGADAVEGMRFELSGDALDLVRVDELALTLRVRAVPRLEERSIPAPPSEAGVVAVTIADAFLERADAAIPKIDPADMFATMQRLMSAGEATELGTLLVGVRGTALRAGEGELVLTARPAGDASVAAGRASIAVRVTDRRRSAT